MNNRQEIKMNSSAFALILLALTGGGLYSQEKAITNSGKSILIFPNGTWKEEKPHQLAIKGIEFKKPITSTERASILRGKAFLYFNPSKWKQKGPEESGRVNFISSDGDAQAIIITERIQMPIESLLKTALENAKKAAPDAEITVKEARRVNGLDITMMQIKGTIDNTPFCYFNYYYSSDKGVIQAITFTSSNLFNEFKPVFEEFLNGLSLEP